MPLAIAHRGDPYRHRENTLPAVLAAIEQGADLVEVDVATTRDGVVVLLHDDTLTRLWGNGGEISRLSAEQVRAVCAGDAYEIPTFEEALEASVAAATGLMIDVRDARVTPPVARAVAERGGFDHHVFAGDAAALVLLRRRWPEARIALSWDEAARPGDDLLALLRPEFFNPYWRLLDRALVDRMHAGGYQVSTWTVDEPSEMVRLLELGVDAVITNRLAHLLAVRDHHRAGPRGIIAAPERSRESSP